MKVFTKNDNNKDIAYVHLYDLPYLAAEGVWTEGLETALETQYGYTHPFMIDSKDASLLLCVEEKNDQNVLKGAIGIPTFEQMQQPSFGNMLFQEEKKVRKQVSEEEKRNGYASIETTMRYRQLICTADTYLKVFGEQVKNSIQHAVYQETTQGYQKAKQAKAGRK